MGSDRSQEGGLRGHTRDMLDSGCMWGQSGTAPQTGATATFIKIQKGKRTSGCHGSRMLPSDIGVTNADALSVQPQALYCSQIRPNETSTFCICSNSAVVRRNFSPPLTPPHHHRSVSPDPRPQEGSLFYLAASLSRVSAHSHTSPV